MTALWKARTCKQSAQGWPQQPLFLYVLAANGQARAVYRRMGGFETIHQDVAMPGNVTLPAMQVTWQDVPGLSRRLPQRNGGVRGRLAALLFHLRASPCGQAVARAACFAISWSPACPLRFLPPWKWHRVIRSWV